MPNGSSTVITTASAGGRLGTGGGDVKDLKGDCDRGVDVPEDIANLSNGLLLLAPGLKGLAPVMSGVTGNGWAAANDSESAGDFVLTGTRYEEWLWLW